MGYTLICFNLSHDLEEDVGYVNLRKSGTVPLKMHFKNELTEIVNIFVYGNLKMPLKFTSTDLLSLT